MDSWLDGLTARRWPRPERAAPGWMLPRQAFPMRGRFRPCSAVVHAEKISRKLAGPAGFVVRPPRNLAETAPVTGWMPQGALRRAENAASPGMLHCAPVPLLASWWLPSDPSVGCCHPGALHRPELLAHAAVLVHPTPHLSVLSASGLQQPCS